MHRNDNFCRISATTPSLVPRYVTAAPHAMSSPHSDVPVPLSVGDTTPYEPTPQRPVRSRARSMPADAHFEPHQHAWAQLAYCASGLIQVNVSTPGGAATSRDSTTIVPPSRAVWIPPGALHAVTVLEAAELRTLYIEARALPASWQQPRVLVVSPLLRELIEALDGSGHDAPAAAREQALMALLLDELTRADTQPLGIALPRDKRLRALCEAVLRAPAERASLAEWASDIGASERTVARLFRTELGTGYQRWRQQVLLAHALPMLAQGRPVGEVAAASGYASDSAFSAMFRAAMGQSPSQFQQGVLPR